MPTAPRYAAIFFDLYGALIDIETDEEADRPWEALQTTLQAYGIFYDLGELRRVFTEQQDRLVAARTCESGEPSSQEPDLREPDLSIVYRLLFTLRGVDPTEQMIAESALSFRRGSILTMQPYSRVRQTLRTLHDAGYQINLLSNAQSLYTMPELAQSGLDRSFDNIFISSEVGWKKPSSNFYKHALRCAQQTQANIGTASNTDNTDNTGNTDNTDGFANRCLMVGNDPFADIDGARAVGMDGIYLHTSSWFADAPQALLQLNGADYEGLLRFMKDNA